MLTNLLQETIKMLSKHGKSEEDIKLVGLTETHEYMSWNQFRSVAARINYKDSASDNLCAYAVIRLDLVILGENWWMERMVNDGTERWHFCERPSFAVHEPKFDILNDSSKDRCSGCGDILWQISDKIC